MSSPPAKLLLAAIAAAALAALPVAAAAQAPVAQSAAAQPAGPTYADIATLADAAGVVAVVQVRSQAVVEPARAPGLAPGHARLYLQARTQALLAGRAALGESLAYLADVPLTAAGKVPKLKKQRFVVFADSVAGRSGELQLVAPNAQLPADPLVEQRVRTIVAALAAPDAPPRVTRLRDVISVPGNLAGESETQLFLETDTGAPVSLTVVRRPGMAPQWGVSWSEIVDQAASPPDPETIGWFRLACTLPQQLPREAHLGDGEAARAQAAADYRLVLDQLGPCRRTRS